MLRKEGRELHLINLFRETWWVLMFFIFTFTGFVYATSYQRNLAEEIESKIGELVESRQTALENKEYLEQKMYSRDDSEFISLTLKKVLGVTPKGQKKVLFKQMN